MTRLLGPAKLTLELRVVGVRADGYHLIDAECVTVDLADELHVGPGRGVTYGGVHPVAAPPGGDLVSRALRLVGRSHDTAVHVVKHIPVGGGLGGGSADAAAIVRWAGHVDPRRFVELGADVPFCVRGGRARVTGIGEIVEPLEHQPRSFTLMLPPLSCSTVEVYQAWDELGGPVGETGNDLEAAALRVEPELARWRDRLGEATGQVPRLAGSGSTWFVDGAYPGEHRVVVKTVAPMAP